MNFLGADVFQSIVTFFEGVRDSLSLEYLLYIFIGLELLAIIVFVVATHFIYELRLVRAIDRLNVFLYDVQYINENNLIELNNLMKHVPRTLRYHWQEYMLNRDKSPSYYMSVENCIDRPLKTSAFQAIIKIVKSLGFVFAGLAFLFTCGYAAGVGDFGADFFITVFTIPVFIFIINYLFVIGLNIRMAANTTELYQTFHIFNRFIDKAVSTMPEYVDFEVLFTEKEIRRGIPVLNEYIEKRQIQEQEELKRARENAIQHEQYNFEQAGEKGELVLERAMKETEIFVGIRTRLNTEIQHFESEIESLKRNFENTTKDYQKKLQASKENSQRLREQQEATTNRLENNYIRKQQSDEIKKQEQIEKDQEDAQLRFNQEINNLSDQIAQRKQEIAEAKVNLEKAMLAEYETFANKIFKEVKEDVNKKVRDERDGLIKSREEVERELEEAVNRIDLLEKQNKILVNKTDQREAYIKAEIGKEKQELEKQLKEKEAIISERDKQIRLLTEDYSFDENKKLEPLSQTKTEDEFGGYYDDLGNYRNKDGTYYDKEGNFHDENGNVFDKEGNLIFAAQTKEEPKQEEKPKEDFSMFDTPSEEEEIKEPEGERGSTASEAEVKEEAKQPKKRPGRPKKVVTEPEVKEPKKRGRPRKETTQATPNTEPKKRGRPKKEVIEPVVTEPKKRGRPRKETVEPAPAAEPKKRGRPRKETAEPAPAAEPKKRGRPRKEVSEPVATEPKKRGRPRKIDIDENLKQIEARLKEQNELLKQQQKALEVTVKNATRPTEE